MSYLFESDNEETVKGKESAKSAKKGVAALLFDLSVITNYLRNRSDDDLPDIKEALTRVPLAQKRLHNTEIRSSRRIAKENQEPARRLVKK